MWKLRRAGLEAALLALLYAVFLSPLAESTALMIFHNRDIVRGYGVLEGRIPLFGPEVTGGGHLPGPFYYFLLALPLGLDLGWRGTFYLLALFHGAAAGALWWFFRSRFGLLSAILAVLCWASAFTTLSSLHAILNASFSLLFSVLVVMSLALAYGEERNAREKEGPLRAAMLFLALGLQLHLSLSIFAGALLFLQLAGRRLGLHPPSGRAFAKSLLFLSPLLPYLAWRAGLQLGMHIGHQPAGFLEVEGGFSNFLRVGYFSPVGPLGDSARYLGLWPTVKLVLEQARNSLLDMGGLTWPCIFLGAWWLARFVYRRAARRPGPRTEGISLVLLVCATLSLILAIVGMGGGFHIWRYTGCFAVSYAMFVASSLGGLRIAQRAVALGAVLAALGYLWWFGPHSSSVERITASPAFASFPPGSELERMARKVREETGWSYQMFRQRAFYVNVFNEVSPEAIFEELDRREPVAVKEGASPPDGYFVAKRQFPQDWELSAKAPGPWLRSQRLPENLSEGIASGGIRLGAAAEIGSLLLIPYRTMHRHKLPPFFQNRAEDYQNSQGERIEAALAEQRARPRQVLVAEQNACPGAPAVCAFAFVARSEDLRDSRKPLTVELLGLPISVASQYVSNDWTQALFEPYAGYLCEGAREPVKLVLAPAVGFHVMDSWILNHSFLAPYRREVKLECGGKAVEKLLFGYKSSSAMSHGRELPLPAAESGIPLAR